jgi:hypothetical protein
MPNFARKHETLKGQTPAMASGLRDRAWSIRELLESAASEKLAAGFSVSLNRRIDTFGQCIFRPAREFHGAHKDYLPITDGRRRLAGPFRLLWLWLIVSRHLYPLYDLYRRTT